MKMILPIKLSEQPKKDDTITNTADNVTIDAKDGYDKVLFNSKTPYDLIITDLQMESDFAPMIAGEWFVRQIQTFPSYLNTKILIVSAMYNIEMTAVLLGVDFLSKRMLISGGELPLKLKLEEMGIIKE